MKMSYGDSDIDHCAGTARERLRVSKGLKNIRIVWPTHLGGFLSKFVNFEVIIDVNYTINHNFKQRSFGLILLTY